MIVKFTARTVERLKPEAGRRLECFDRAVPGLALRVSERGAKSWALLYRTKRGGRLRRLTLGSTAVLTLADARARARDELARVRNGADPASEKRQDRKAETIADLARDYLERHAKPRKRSWKDDDRLLRAEILPRWKHKAIADVTRRDVRRLVDAIAERGAPTLANRTTALVSKLFKFALDDELIDTSPAVRIPRPAPERQRDRVLTDDEIRQLWTALDRETPEMAAAFRLRLITAQRGGEVTSMRWADVDLAGGWWTIPAEHSKNGLPHRVPLTDPALTILRALRAQTRADAVYVLAGARGKRQRSEAAARLGLTDFRGHDLRRTAASRMASAGVPRLVIGKVLNHVERDITRVYDRHSYDPEKRTALETWARTLITILKRKHGGGAGVVPIARGR